MVQRGGQVRAQVIKNVRAVTVLPIIRENVEKNSEVFTDRASIYRQLWIDYVHASVDHATEYVRDNVHTNSIENFWSLLKRTIKELIFRYRLRIFKNMSRNKCLDTTNARVTTKLDSCI